MGTAQFYADEAIRRLNLTNPFGCGITTQGHELRDDGPPEFLLDDNLDTRLKQELLKQTETWEFIEATQTWVPFDPHVHGQMEEWLKEGQPLPKVAPINGDFAIHRHNAKQQSGPYRFAWEAPKTS